MKLLLCERGIRKNVLFEACCNKIVETSTREDRWEILLFYNLFLFLIMEKKLMHTFRFLF
jgi:hypothetical protein